jgi:hypothetical protein
MIFEQRSTRKKIRVPKQQISAPAQNARSNRGSAPMSSSAGIPAAIIGGHIGRMAQMLLESENAAQTNCALKVL